VTLAKMGFAGILDADITRTFYMPIMFDVVKMKTKFLQRYAIKNETGRERH
jgi:hypothetical protein